MAEAPRDRDHLLVQLHHDPGARRTAETLVPPPTPNPARVAFGYLGDVQLRFMFQLPGEGPESPARMDDLTRLDLTPNRALAVAALNVRKLCGEPLLSDLGGGVHAVRGPHHEYILAYLLDRGFWRRQLAQHAKGLVVALPRRGLLLFAPLEDVEARTELVKRAVAQAKSAGGARVSDCVLRFDATGWHLAGALPGVTPAATPAPVAAPAPKAARARIEDDEDDESVLPDTDGLLDDAAAGQRTLVRGFAASLPLQALLVAGWSPWLMLLLTLAASGYAALGVIRLCGGLEKSLEETIAWMAAGFVPVAGLVAWLWLHLQANRELRDGGRQVNWLGARA